MTLLLLAGSGEAQIVARKLADQGTDAVAALAGGARGGSDIPLPLRRGGFGGPEGFGGYLAEQGITAVLDATHPFAARITARTAAICAERGLPYCLLQRPPWQPEPGDCWTLIDREEEAARHITPGSIVFLATGRQTLERFANLGQCTLICRQIDPPDAPFPFDNGRFLVGGPPFSVAQEKALFTKLGVDWLVVKNAGGAASATKLTAARELAIRVAMINRPPHPEGVTLVETVEAALEWVAAL